MRILITGSGISALFASVFSFISVEINATPIPSIQFNAVTTSPTQISIQCKTTDHNLAGDSYNAGNPEINAQTRILAIPPLGNPEIEEIRLLVNGEEERFRTEQLTGFNDESLPVKLGSPAIMRGIRVLPVTVYTTRTNAVSGSVDRVDECSIRLTFGNEIGLNPVLRPRRHLGRGFTRFAEATLLNVPNITRDDDTPYGGIYLYLVPDVDGVLEALEPLVEWKMRSGSLVQVQTVAGDQNSIMDAIQDAYDEWEIPPEYVVLVGEAEGENALAPWQEADPVTDFNYSLVDGDDFLPDLAIGRLSWESLNELQDMVTKIVEYESEPDIENGWLDHALSCTATNDVQSSQILVCRWVYERML